MPVKSDSRISKESNYFPFLYYKLYIFIRTRNTIELYIMYTARAHHISLQSWDINWQAVARDGFRTHATGAYVLLRGALTIRPPRRDAVAEWLRPPRTLRPIQLLQQIEKIWNQYCCYSQKSIIYKFTIVVTFYSTINCSFMKFIVPLHSILH